MSNRICRKCKSEDLAFKHTIGKNGASFYGVKCKVCKYQWFTPQTKETRLFFDALPRELSKRARGYMKKEKRDPLF